jgi:hypothetical protein
MIPFQNDESRLLTPDNIYTKLLIIQPFYKHRLYVLSRRLIVLLQIIQDDREKILLKDNFLARLY